MFDKAMRKSVEPFLQSGEDVLSVSIVQGKGMTKWIVGAGVAGATAAGARRDSKAGEDVALSSKMGLVITSQRLLLFKAGGAVTVKAKELLTEVPISDVDSIVQGKAKLAKPLTVSVRGEAFEIEAPKAVNTDKIVEALERARAGAAAAV